MEKLKKQNKTKQKQLTTIWTKTGLTGSYAYVKVVI